MFLRKPIMKSTGNYSEQIEKLKTEIETADAILIPAASIHMPRLRNIGRGGQDTFS